MEAFVGTWRLVDSENYDSYMRELGMNFATRQLGNVTKPTTVIKVDGDQVTLQSFSTYRSTEITFILDKPFDEHTTDNRNCKTVVTFEGEKLIQIQKWDGKQTTLVREIRDGKLILTLTLNDVVSVRTYEREA
ncbi:fatty acid-binding protein, brain-like [Pristis pectinata]|uniref:fatty acid-binding protein, brain-like n=1 Tax=Pristis pectinata TaxID=685728 RepID=UPI00223DAE0A|nr:fatty acid-binding protein, brain-like [Pristis pectinata]